MKSPLILPLVAGSLLPSCLQRPVIYTGSQLGVHAQDVKADIPQKTSICDPVPEVISHSGRQPVAIQSRTYWNDTGIMLQKGQRYQFHVSGTWKDWIYQASPDGPVSPLINAVMFPLRPLLRYSPLRDWRANYFQPIGTIGRGEGKTLPSHAFIIRDGMTCTAPASGILHVFANDAPWESAYANNCGILNLTVSKAP